VPIYYILKLDFLLICAIHLFNIIFNKERVEYVKLAFLVVVLSLACVERERHYGVI